MNKFIVCVSCDSQSSSPHVREKYRKPTSYVTIRNSNSVETVLLEALNNWEKGNDLWFWKTYPKDLKFLKVKGSEMLYQDEIVYRLKNIPYTHFYNMKDNKIKLSDGHNTQVISIVPYDKSIFGVITDIDTLDSQFVNSEIYQLVKNNANNIIKMFFDADGLTSDIFSYPSDKEGGFFGNKNEFRVPNEVIDYNKFNYETGMVRGDSHFYREKENFLHFDLVVN